MADITSVLAALEVFSGAPDKASLERANAYLQDFQHSVKAFSPVETMAHPDRSSLFQSEAWATCNVLLLSQDAPNPAKLFAAYTFRAKASSATQRYSD